VEKSYHIGLDVHRRFSQAAVLDDQGALVEKVKLANDPELFMEFFDRFPDKTPVSLEATLGWEWIADLLQEQGLEVRLANPLKVKLIAESTIKTDTVDAATLAQLERTDFLPCCYFPPPQVRGTRDLLRHRFALVSIRKSAKNRVHGILAKRGIQHHLSDLFGSTGRKFLSGLELPTVHRQAMDNYLALIDLLTEMIKKQEKQIKNIVTTEKPEARLLLSIPGIGHLSALLLTAEIGDIKRFPSAKKLASFAGLVPTTSQSADKTHHGHIKKDSNKYIRWILIEAVDKAVRKDPGLACVYYKLAKKKGKPKARVAIAHKLLQSVYYMLRDNEQYKTRKPKNYFRVNPGILLAAAR
jgi:transposase